MKHNAQKSTERLSDVQKLVNAIVKNKNVKASKCLEDILKQKCSKKIADTLKS